ncbi:MAG: ferritin-like domain-containing protein [Tepidiformaceae bacterium]
MTVTPTSQPGLDLSWLNIDDEWGAHAAPGRKGLTLEDLNVMSYGRIPSSAGAPTMAMRGAKTDPRSPRHGRQYRDKADVWSEAAMMLYEEAMQRQWSSAVDIPWHEISPDLPTDLEMAMCTLCTFLTQVEFIAGDLPGRFMGQVPGDHFETQLFLGTQVVDEARHEDVFRKRALVNGGGLVDANFGASTLLTADDFTEMTCRLHLFGEGFVQTIFRMGELISTNEAEKRIFRLAAQDESRHLAFGVTHLKYVLDVNPERREELHHYLDLQEGALGQAQSGLTVNPATSEAVAVLAGGGIDKIDEGYQKVLLLRKKQINEYFHRLEVIGLGDRKERMAPAMRVFLEG